MPAIAARAGLVLATTGGADAGMETDAPGNPVAAEPDAGERHNTAPQSPARKRGRPVKAWVPSPDAQLGDPVEHQPPQCGQEDAADWGLIFDATYRRKSRERQRRRNRPRKAPSEAQIASNRAREAEARIRLVGTYKRTRQHLPEEQRDHTPTAGELFWFAEWMRREDRDAALIYNAECEAEHVRIRRLRAAEQDA